MKAEKSYQELLKENAELKDILKKVIKANESLNEQLNSYREKLAVELSNSTVSNSSDVKKLLEKYSRL